MSKDRTVEETKPEAIKLAEWAEWFLRNIREPLDFRWTQMEAMAKELRRLHAENQRLQSSTVPDGWRLVPVEMALSQKEAAQDTWWHACTSEMYWEKIYAAVLDAAPTSPAFKQHSDDAAVDNFADAMKAKLAEAREKGRGGWDDPEQCTVEHLAKLLVDHIPKGDPIDVANFAMMLHQRGADKSALATAVAPQPPVAKQPQQVEMLGETCIDGGKCHHKCTDLCFRRECCAPFSDYSGPWKYDQTQQIGVEETVGETTPMPGAAGFTTSYHPAMDVSIGTDLYTHPHPKREPLTEEYIKRMWHDEAKLIATSRTLPFEWYRLGVRHAEHAHDNLNQIKGEEK